MGRRLYWQDSYGGVHRDRDAERSRRGSSFPGPARLALRVLVVLAVIMVIASMVH
jgi:hypothetical protein